MLTTIKFKLVQKQMEVNLSFKRYQTILFIGLLDENIKATIDTISLQRNRISNNKGFPLKKSKTIIKSMTLKEIKEEDSE